MDSSMTPPAKVPSPLSTRRTLRTRCAANPSALASFIFSIVWIVGVGSVIGIVLGIKSVRKSRGVNENRDGIGLANAGIVIGLVGIVIASLFWTEVANIGGVRTDTSSPSYVDGSTFATENYANATSEASLCVKTNAQSYDNPTQWVSGCHDGWFIAAHSLTYPGMPGLNM